MVSKSLGIAVLATVCFVSFSWAADFRGNNWGDSPEAVQVKEGEGLICLTRPPGWGDKDYTKFIGYNPSNYLGVDGIVVFVFNHEVKLGKVLCFSLGHDIGSFYEWEKALSASYGEPENRDDLLTKDESILDVYYRGDAAAVEEGLLKVYFTLIRFWETGKTYIWLVAELYDDKLEVHINYYSKEYFDFFREEKTLGGTRKGFRPWFDNDGQ